MPKQDILKGRYSTYQIFEPIGEGGSATVYRGVDRHTNTPVAIKEMIAFDDEMVQQWRVEVEMLMKLNHDDTHEEYIIRYLDHIHSGKSMLLVEEFAANGSLLRLLRQRKRANAKFTEIEVAFYVHSIVRALAYIHSKKIIHRDLKAANVLLTQENNVKLSDFGLAVASPAVLRRVVGESATSFVSTTFSNVNKYSTMSSNNLNVSSNSNNASSNSNGISGMNSSSNSSINISGSNTSNINNTHAEGPLGSVYWFAPEVAQGVSHSCASDIWALGCVALELLTGHPPFFQRPSINALYTIAHCTEPPLPLSPEAGPVVMLEEPISEHCMNFFKCCFAIVPTKRSSAAALVHHDWFVNIFMHMQLNSLLVKLSKARLNEKPQVTSTNNSNSSTSTSLKTTPSSLPSSTTSKTGKAIVGVPSSRLTQSKEIKHTININNNNIDIITSDSNSSINNTNTNTLMKNAPYESLSQWVENSLFMSSTELREKWLESDDVLIKIVAVLKSITAEESFSVIRSFAFAAERCLTEVHSAFLSKLGETMLWEYYLDLRTLCRLEHLGTIFYCCCVAQPINVINFAPSTPQALQFFLTQDDETVLQKVFTGLEELYLTHYYTNTTMKMNKSNINTTSDKSLILKDKEEKKQESKDNLIETKIDNNYDNTQQHVESEECKLKESRQEAALIRLAHDGGLLVLRNIIQESIQSVSIYNKNRKINAGSASSVNKSITTTNINIEPRLTWKRIDTLIHICERAAKLSENTEAHEMILGVADSHELISEQSATTSMTAKRNNNYTIKNDVAVNKERVEILPSLLWFMSLQEASRQHCSHALHLLLYIITCHTSNNTNTNTNKRSASITNANISPLSSKQVTASTSMENNTTLPLFRSFVILAGEIIVQNLLLIAIDEETCVVDKVAIAHVLCRFQQTSPRAHNALLNRNTCIPLIAHLMRCLMQATTYKTHEEQLEQVISGEPKQEEEEIQNKIDNKSICNALESILALCDAENFQIMATQCTNTLVFVQVLWEVLVWCARQDKEEENNKEQDYLILEQRLIPLLTRSTTQKQQSFTVHDFLRVNDRFLLVRWLYSKIINYFKENSAKNIDDNNIGGDKDNHDQEKEKGKSNDTNNKVVTEWQTLLSCLTTRAEFTKFLNTTITL